jgi:hypothetical protein
MQQKGLYSSEKKKLVARVVRVWRAVRHVKFRASLFLGRMKKASA